MIMLPLLGPHSSEQLVFLSEEERVSLSQFNPCVEQCHTGLLDKLFSTDISTVYRLGRENRYHLSETCLTCYNFNATLIKVFFYLFTDRLDDSDFTYIRNQPKQGNLYNLIYKSI